MADAEADAEAAFINSMQAMNGVTGSYEATGAARQHQTDSISSDEYDPAQAVQSSDSNQNLSLDTSNHDALSAISPLPMTSDPAPTAQLSLDTSAAKAHGQSDLMSRESSSSSSAERHPEPETDGNGDGPLQGDQEQSGGAKQSSTDGHLGIDRDVTGPAASLSNTSINRLSTKDVLIQNDVQDQSASAVVQNGVSSTDSNRSVVSPDVGTISSIEFAAKPLQPASAAETIDAVSSAVEQATTPSIAAPKLRLPHDRIGILEDRIKEDPRGDLDAWLNLIGEHRKRGKLEDARKAYERFLGVFPSCAEQWVAYAQMENESQNRAALEKIFHNTLLQIPNIQLWSMYLDHIRRHNNTTTDASGAARQIIHQAYDLALQHVGLDKDSGRLWQDYVQFIKSGPGIIGGSNWQDQQKMDLLRKTYQRAICVPTQSTNMLWKEYDGFENGLNKMTGRKFLQDQSPGYMTARSSNIELQNITRGLRRTTLPVLPPAPGFDGDIEYLEQLEIWKRWIQWEKNDPLVLKPDDIAAYRDRVVFVYKQALMAMRFWPELWCDAADFCFLNTLEAEGNDFLTNGIAANPESCLLTFKRADRLELNTANEEGDESIKRRGAAVREPFDRLLDALYDLIGKAKAREAQDLARIEAQFAIDDIEQRNGINADDRDEDFTDEDREAREKRKAEQLDGVKNVNAAQIRLLSQTVSYVWIALMRAMRRIQGKGKVNEQIGGSRQIFTDARKRGRITSDVYVASALIEFHCYDPETTKKIFERGLKLFPDDEGFALEYIRHLIANNDHTNARVVFETAVSKLTQKAETLSRAKPLYAFIHDFESRYGELAQIVKLEKRMSDHFPEDPLLVLFSRRFTNHGFNPTAIRPIISPHTQARPKASPSNQQYSTANYTSPKVVQKTTSPKRPLPLDDSDTDGGRPPKLARNESPLAGAAGRRRLDQQKRHQPAPDLSRYEGQFVAHAPPPPDLPRDVLILLSMVPNADTYDAPDFKVGEM
ncbi:mRNA 3'-end-processing protein rna14, partial [Sticta canariensis]|nr:mRNA 3'-end-processing protein rna14 [Sticta canariensis]